MSSNSNRIIAVLLITIFSLIVAIAAVIIIWVQHVRSTHVISDQDHQPNIQQEPFISLISPDYKYEWRVYSSLGEQGNCEILPSAEECGYELVNRETDEVVSKQELTHWREWENIAKPVYWHSSNQIVNTASFGDACASNTRYWLYNVETNYVDQHIVYQHTRFPVQYVHLNGEIDETYVFDTIAAKDTLSIYLVNEHSWYTMDEEIGCAGPVSLDYEKLTLVGTIAIEPNAELEIDSQRFDGVYFSVNGLAKQKYQLDTTTKELIDLSERKLQHLYSANGGLVGFYNDGTVAGCPKCDYFERNVAVLNKKQPHANFIEMNNKIIYLGETCQAITAETKGSGKY